MQAVQADQGAPFVGIDAHLHATEGRAHEVEVTHQHAPARAARQRAPMSLDFDERIRIFPHEEGAPKVDPPVAEHPVEAGGREFAVERQAEGAAFGDGAVRFADDGSETQVAQSQGLFAAAGREVETGAQRQVDARADRLGGKSESAETGEPGFAAGAEETSVGRDGDFGFA